jgi:DNA polymerase elongation subunit (family B)
MMAISYTETDIVVDLNQLDLTPRTDLKIPNWQPKFTQKSYAELKKVYCDIETTGLDSDIHRITAIGIKLNEDEPILITNKDERIIIAKFFTTIKEIEPDLLIFHNGFGFDLPFIEARTIKYFGDCVFWRASDRPSRLTNTIMGFEFHHIKWEGIQIIDTMHQTAIWDFSRSVLSSFSLKIAPVEMGLRSARPDVPNPVLLWEQGKISELLAYLVEDLEDTKLLADEILPPIYWQRLIVPSRFDQDKPDDLQYLATSNIGRRCQNIHLGLYDGIDATPQDKWGFEGGISEAAKLGLFYNVAKIDVTSLYPSIMLLYGVCSSKDVDMKFLGVLKYLKEERLKQKALAKTGDLIAEGKQAAYKILINGSYGFLGTPGLGYNDYEAAALVTAYGRKILRLMESTINDCGGEVISLDTDGIYYSATNWEDIYKAVAAVLPTGIEIECELFGCVGYFPKAKNYLIYDPNSEKVSRKGVFRKKNKLLLLRQFTETYILTLVKHGVETANKYYKDLYQSVVDRTVDINLLTYVTKISKTDKRLSEANLGKSGEVVRYYEVEEKRFGKTGKPLKSAKIPTHEALFYGKPYWVEWYCNELEKEFKEINKVLNSTK